MRHYAYDEVLEACAAGDYPSCEIRAASGRLNRLLGLDAAAYRNVERLARAHGVGLILVGSRVSGPRARQRTLHPALAAMPLATDHRAASAIDPGAAGVRIEKTVIKEYGRGDPRTSDLSVLLVCPTRSDAERSALAATLEAELNGPGLSFPVRVFTRLNGAPWRREEDFADEGEAYLRELAPDAPFTPAQRREAVAELYTTVNLRRPPLLAADWRNAALTAGLFTASFSLGLGFHPVLPAVGFAFGLGGRYLSRLRAGTARVLGDGWLGNAAALALDAAVGAGVMGLLVVPATGLPIGWSAILAGSLGHTLSKGTLRLWLDKRFASGTVARQSRGVLAVSALNFAQGVVTSLAYGGSTTARLVQFGVCLLGAWLLFSATPARRPAPPARSP